MKGRELLTGSCNVKKPLTKREGREKKDQKR